MTRINVGILPQELSNRHLLAEHREIKRIPNLIRKGRYRLESVPPTFRLGQGHVAFFYDKLKFLHKRYQELHMECLKRGFNVQDYNQAWENLPKPLLGDYLPSLEDRKIILERLEEKKRKKLGKS